MRIYTVNVTLDIVAGSESDAYRQIRNMLKRGSGGVDYSCEHIDSEVISSRADDDNDKEIRS